MKVKPSSLLMKVALLTICQERTAIELKESVVMASITGMLRVARMLSVPLSILLFLRWECLSLLSTPMCFMRGWPKIYYPKCLWVASLWWTMPVSISGRTWSRRLMIMLVIGLLTPQHIEKLKEAATAGRILLARGNRLFGRSPLHFDLLHSLQQQLFIFHLQNLLLQILKLLS